MAMVHLEACERELDLYLQKVECAKQTLIDAKNAICKAKLSIQEVPGTVFENDFQKLLLSILQSKESDGQLQEEKMRISLADNNEHTVEPPHVEQSRIKVISKDEKLKVEDHSQKEDTAVHATKPWKDRGKMFMKVASSLFPNGTFWCVPEYNIDKSALRAISERLRKETMSNKSLWNCDTSKKDQIVCVLSKAHNLWLRGLIEKSVSETEVILRYIDYGRTEKVPKNRVNRIPADMNDLQPLMRWKFKDLTNHKTLVVNIKDEIIDGLLPRYVVSLREPDDDSFDIVENLCKEALLQAQNTGMGSSIQSKDVRIYGNASGNSENLSIVQDVYNSKKQHEEDTRTEDGDKGKSEVPSDKSKSEMPVGETEKVDGNSAVAKPDLKIEVEASEEAVNWADLCKTPDVNENEEHEFLPLDESIFDSDCKVNELGTDVQQPSSKPENPAPPTDGTPTCDDSKAYGSFKLEKGCIDREVGKGDSCEKLLPSTTTDKDKNQEKVHGTNVKEAKNKVVKEINEDNVADQCDFDVLRVSQQVIEERLRNATEFSKKKPTMTHKAQLSKKESNGDGTLAVKGTEIGSSGNAIATPEALESTRMTTNCCGTEVWSEGEALATEETNLSKTDESSGKEGDIARQKEITALKADDACSEKRRSTQDQEEVKIMIEEKQSKEHDSLHQEVDSSLKRHDKGIQPASCGVSSEFENASCSEVNSNSEKFAIVVDTAKADGPEQEPAVNASDDASKVTVDSTNITASKVDDIAHEGDKKSKVSNGKSEANTERARKALNDTSKPRGGNESSSHQRFHHGSGRTRRGDIMANDDLRTLPNEDREKWNALQLKGLQDSVLDKRNTKYFVVETGANEMASAFKSSRYLLASLADMKEILTKHLPQPVILLMVLLAPNDSRRLCAIASVVSKPYSFDVRARNGSWRTVDIFDLKFLCKARSRRLWDHHFRHQEELRRNVVNRLLGEYAKSIRNGLIDKLLDEESDWQSVQHTQLDPTGKAPPDHSKPPISQENDVDHKKGNRQNSSFYQMPPRMKHTSRKVKFDEHSPDVEYEAVMEQKDVKNPRHDIQSSLRVNVKVEGEADGFFEYRELWSPTSPSSQPNANLRPIPIDETRAALDPDINNRKKEQEHDQTNPHAQYMMLQQYMLACQLMLTQQQEQQQQQQQSPNQTQFPQQQSHVLQQQYKQMLQQQEILQQHANRQHQIVDQPPQQPPMYTLTDEQNQILHQSLRPTGMPGLLDSNGLLSSMSSASGSTAGKETDGKFSSNLDDFGSDDEAERNLERDLDVFGLDKDDL